MEIFMSSLYDFCSLTHTNSSLCANKRMDNFASSSDLQVEQMSVRHRRGMMLQEPQF